MTVRPLPLREIRSFTFNGFERVMQNPDGPPTGRQLLALWHLGALAIVHPDNEAHVFKPCSGGMGDRLAAGRRVSGRLLEPLALPPFVLAEQDAAELGELVGWVVERSEDCSPVRDGERDDRLAIAECFLEHGGCLVVEQRDELADLLRTMRDAGDEHAFDYTSFEVPP